MESSEGVHADDEQSYAKFSVVVTSPEMHAPSFPDFMWLTSQLMHPVFWWSIKDTHTWWEGLQQSVFSVYRICDQGPGPLPNLHGFLAMVLHGSHFELLILLGGDCTGRSLQGCWILQDCVGRIWRWDSSSSLLCVLHFYLADQQLFAIASLTHLVEKRELEEQKNKNKSRIRRIDEG